MQLVATRRMARNIATQCLAVRTRRLGRLVARLYDDALRPHGLRITQLNLLVAIAGYGPLTAKQLGEALDLEKSTVSRNLARMADSGWLRPGGERGQALELTPTGERLLAEAEPAWRRAQRRAVQLMGADAAASLDALRTAVSER